MAPEPRRTRSRYAVGAAFLAAATLGACSGGEPAAAPGAAEAPPTLSFGEPSDPDKGLPVPEPETSPVSGTPESVSNVRRDGSESKPHVVVDDKTS